LPPRDKKRLNILFGFTGAAGTGGTGTGGVGTGGTGGVGTGGVGTGGVGTGGAGAVTFGDRRILNVLFAEFRIDDPMRVPVLPINLPVARNPDLIPLPALIAVSFVNVFFNVFFTLDPISLALTYVACNFSPAIFDLSYNICIIAAYVGAPHINI
jgi:hypothetical protein